MASVAERILKFQSYTTFLIFAIRQNIYNFILSHDCLIYHKFGSNRLKTVADLELRFEILLP